MAALAELVEGQGPTGQRPDGRNSDLKTNWAFYIVAFQVASLLVCVRSETTLAFAFQFPSARLIFAL